MFISAELFKQINKTLGGFTLSSSYYKNAKQFRKHKTIYVLTVYLLLSYNVCCRVLRRVGVTERTKACADGAAHDAVNTEVERSNPTLTPRLAS